MCEEITIHRQFDYVWQKYYPQIVDYTIYEAFA